MQSPLDTPPPFFLILKTMSAIVPAQPEARKTPCTSPAVTGGNSPGGFALVLALSLMAFVLVLILSISTLVRVESASAENRMQQLRARQNALLGMRIALGELQKEMGPDQRINANAARELDNDKREASPRRYWTGVFNGWVAEDGGTLEGTAAEKRPEPDFRRWLVSARNSSGGGKPDWLARRDEGLEADLPEPVTLVEGEDANRVEAGRVAVGGSGGYAWWVGDENAKALLRRGQQPEQDLRDWLRNRTIGAQTAYPLIGDLEDLSPLESGLDLLHSRNTLPLINGGTDAPADGSRFHQVTPLSFGVAANTRRGGLRKDLSIYLEKTATEMRNLSDEEAEEYHGGLYTAPGLRHDPNDGNKNRADAHYLRNSPESIDLGGVSMGELQTYHTLWRDLEPGGGSHPDGGSLPAGPPKLTGRFGGTDGAFRDQTAPYKTPVIIRGGTILAIKTRPVSSGEEEEENQQLYDVELRFDAIATLWNPYDVSIRIPEDTFKAFVYATSYQMRFFRSKNPSAGFKERILFRAQRLSWAPDNTINWIALEIGESTPLAMRPGEVLVFSAAGNEGVEYEYSEIEDSANATVKGRLGWIRDGGFTGVGTFDSEEGPLDPDDHLWVRIFPHRESRGGAAIADDTRMMAGGRSSPERYTGMAGKIPGPDGARITTGAQIHVANFPYGQRPKHRYNFFDTKFPQRIGDRKVGTLLQSADDLAGSSDWTDLIFFVTEMRTEDPVAGWSGTPVLRHFNPAVNLYHLNSYRDEDTVAQPFVHRIEEIGLGGNNNTQYLNVGPNGAGNFGGSHDASGVSPIITHSIPRRPPTSLADYQHAAAIGRGHYTPEEVRDTDEWLTHDIRGGGHIEPATGKIIGNAYAPSVLPSDQIRGFTNPKDLPEPVDADIPGVPAVDHSYLANFYLWDNWFLSSISPEPDANYGVARSQAEVWEDFAAGDEPLPNRRMRANPAAGDDFDPEDENAHHRSAAQLLIKGAFNVNSTDPEVWAAQLAALRGAPTPVLEPGSGGPGWEDADSDETPVPGLIIPAAGSVDRGDFGSASGEDQWLGFRKLDDTQIRELAEAIVEEVRERGPFLSLADFINRRPGGDIEHALKGALQAALDRTVNPDEGDMGGGRWLGENSEAAFPQALDIPRSQGMAAWLNQADLLALLGPILTARSDTFTIRTYGEARNSATGEVDTRAWGEALVQRMPAYVDSANTAHTPPDDAEAAGLGLDALTPENRAFGRRFRVLAFRWLDEDEI